MHDFWLLAAALCYLTAVGGLYLSIKRSSGTTRRLAIGMTLVGLACHLAAQSQHWFATATPDVGFLNILSLCALVVVALLVGSLSLRYPVFDAGLVALPIATIVLLAEWAIQVPPILLSDTGLDGATHIISSIMAFGVFSIAGVYALFVALIDHFLRRHHLSPLIRSLPALEVLEQLLFRLITAGFILLTVSLVSGMFFINDMFAQHLAHKTILSIITWVVFGILLWGRRFRGWRGRVAVRLTLAGIGLLLLSYFGSKLVLEVFLQSGWQT
jgi:ABC-type uncharacterized transport system permease subunit